MKTGITFGWCRFCVFQESPLSSLTAHHHRPQLPLPAGKAILITMNNGTNDKTQELTFGALIVAIFTVLLLFNRQSGMLFEEFIFFVLPLPMTVFTLKYGWKDSLPVLFCMAAAAFFMGSIYTLFFSVCEAVIGLVLGLCLRKKINLSHTQIIIMAISALANVFGSVVLTSLFGVDLFAEILEMQQRVSAMLSQNGMDISMTGDLLSFQSILRLFVLSMILYGIMQGFIVFRLSLLILKRLRIPVPEPAPIGLYYPPRWSGYASLFLVVVYVTSLSRPMGSSQIQNIAQTLGLCGYFYLIAFGWISISFLIRKFFHGPKIISMILALIGMLILPYAGLILGFVYISGPFHDWLLRQS